MSRPVKLYDLAPSPNNIKVRLALGYKKIPYQMIPVEFDKREEIIRVSGQPLTPVLLHGDTVVYDSFAILRYLDANWPSPPRLFSPDRRTMQKIEEWEMFVRTEAIPPVGTVFGESSASSPDPDKLRKANEQMNRTASRLEEALSRTPFLMGEAPNAADFTVAPWIYYGALSQEAAARHPIAAFFSRHLKIERAPKVREWLSRVMAWDR